MPQVIKITDMQNIKPLSSLGGEVNQKYHRIRELFRENNDYLMFAEPLKTSENQIKWQTKTDNEIRNYNDLSEDEQNIVREKLKTQAKNLYNQTDKKIEKYLDSFLQIPSIYDIYLVDDRVVLTNWGFVKNRFDAKKDIIKNLMSSPVEDIPATLVPSPITPIVPIDEECKTFFSRHKYKLISLLFLLLLALLLLLLFSQEQKKESVKIDEKRIVKEIRDKIKTDVEDTFIVNEKRIKISIIDDNKKQDEYFDLYINDKFIGAVNNLPGGTTSYEVDLKNGENTLYLKITDKYISNTALIIKIDPANLSKRFRGDDKSYLWKIEVKD